MRGDRSPAQCEVVRPGARGARPKAETKGGGSAIISPKNNEHIAARGG